MNNFPGTLRVKWLLAKKNEESSQYGRYVTFTKIMKKNPIKELNFMFQICKICPTCIAFSPLKPNWGSFLKNSATAVCVSYLLTAMKF